MFSPGTSSSKPVSHRLLSSLTRSHSVKFAVLFLVACTIYLAKYSYLPFELPDPSLHDIQSSRLRSTCPPRSYAAGEWVPRTPRTSRTHLQAWSDVYDFLGFEGCASTREVLWHLGVDNARVWDRFPGVSSWQWQPASECQVRDLDPAALVKDLVERGGWLLVGDSVTENHFFSLSCLLYPHVYATPNYTGVQSYDHSWVQNLYLDPTSPLLSSIRFPRGFSIETTPLVTFRRADLLLEKARLDELYRTLHPDSPQAASEDDAGIFSNTLTFNLAPSEYVAEFTAPLPRGNYATMVVSTGGHWTTMLFAGLTDPGLYKDGIENIVDFFGDAMDAWAREVQTLLDTALARTRKSRSAPKQVVVRAYLPGHDDCHEQRAPWKVIRPGTPEMWNWNEIGQLNDAFEAVLESRRYPDIHFLPIDRPARLRPDAHSSSDCLHLMAGSGVLEGWTQYIWHYVTVELPGRIR